MKSTYLTVNTPLDDSVKRDRKFEVRSVVGEESISSDFDFKLTVCSPERLTEQEIEKLLGQSLTVGIGFRDEKENRAYRYLNGLVYRLTELGLSKAPLMPEIWHYEVEIGSWFRQLAWVRDCRIFQKNGSTSLTIITDLLRELGFWDFKSQVKSNPPRKDFCVQYNESALHFMQRLLLEDGIVFRFEHSAKHHVLTFFDDSRHFPKLSLKRSGLNDTVTAFCKEGSHLPVANCLVSSYHWETAPVKNVTKATGISHARFASFDYSGNFVKREEGEQQAIRQRDRLKSKILTYTGESTIRALQAGTIFELNAPSLPDLHQKPFLVRSLKIEATAERYRNRFILQPASQPYLPGFEDFPDLKKPKIWGTQTAMVVGEGGNGKVQTDKYGCIKVRFHWDHHSPENASHTSAFIRVAGPSAGSQRGFIFTPRVGEEVVVAFEDGNPDKPLVIGSVYSSHNPPSHSPIARPFTSLIKTDDAKDSNQIVFDDKPGAESFNFIAKKDMKLKVGRNLTIDVARDVSIKARSVTIQVAKDVAIKAGGNIVNLSLATINQLAGVAITNTALGGVLNLAGGIVKNTAGGMISNTAILSVANTSALGIKQEAKGVIANTALGAVLNTGSEVVNNGELAVTNLSKLAIINSAGGDINNQAVLQKNTISGISNTEADQVAIKGITKING